VATGWEGLLLILIDEKGRRLTRHQTVALAVRSYLEMQKSAATLVTPNGVSHLVRDLAQDHEIRWAGPLNRDMMAELALLGPDVTPALGVDLQGELTWPAICYSPDSLSALVLILRLMARHQQPLSELVDDLPPYASAEGQVPCPDDVGPTEIMERLATRFAGARISTSPALEKRRDAWWIRADLQSGSWVAVQHAFRRPVLELWTEVALPDRAESLLGDLQSLLGFVPIRT
jgi:phosphomannomutase